MVAAGGGACGGEPAAPISAPIQVGAVTDNSLIMNSLIMNALIMNAVTGNALIMNALTSNALILNGVPPDKVNAGTAQFMKYLVSCALAPNQSVDVNLAGQDYHFTGALGLAPQWGMPGGSCDGSCQRWVSACLLSRVDAAGVEREISIRGLHPALSPAAPSWPPTRSARRPTSATCS